MREKIICPVCKKTKLVLRQINLTCSVYLCRDKHCSYPMGHQWIFVQRTLEEMYNDKKKKTKKKSTKSKFPQIDQFNLDNLIENEINKIQNSTTEEIQPEDFTNLFDSKQSANNSNDFDLSGLMNDSYLENVLCNESVVSKDAVGFCDNFDSSYLNDLLDTASVVNNDAVMKTETDLSHNKVVSDNSVHSNNSKLNVNNESVKNIESNSSIGDEHLYYSKSKLSVNNEKLNIIDLKSSVDITNVKKIELKDDTCSTKGVKLEKNKTNIDTKSCKSIYDVLSESKNVQCKNNKVIILNHYIFNKSF